MKLLGLCGSLRAQSTNATLLAAAEACVPPSASFEVSTLPGELPLFNPDIDPDSQPVLVRWIDQVREADGLIISTPEYARGYPGALKNALDWLVQTDAHIEKPFMLLNASGRSQVAHKTLVTVLETMSGIHIEDASTTIPLLGKNLGVDALLADGASKQQLESALTAFVDGVAAHKQAAIDSE